MKTKVAFLMVAVMMAVLASCSDDNEAKRKGDPDVVHEGDKWTIASINNYTLMDVSGTSVFTKSGSKSNAGSFYFVDDQFKGSFEMAIEGYNKEDLFNFTKETDGSIQIFSVQQSVGVTTNQNILVISGQQTSDTEIILDAVSIVKESTATGIFTLTATQITLTKD